MRKLVKEFRYEFMNNSKFCIAVMIPTAYFLFVAIIIITNILIEC